MSARSLNRATLIGNIGKDPELRRTPQGTSVCTIRLATTEVFKNKNGEWQEATDWHSIVLWDRLAEIAAEMLRKSDRIFVEGKLRTRTFEKDGLKKHFTEIIANNMIILERKNRDRAAPELTESSDKPKEEANEKLFDNSDNNKKDDKSDSTSSSGFLGNDNWSSNINFDTDKI